MPNPMAMQVAAGTGWEVTGLQQRHAWTMCLRGKMQPHVSQRRGDAWGPESPIQPGHRTSAPRPLFQTQECVREPSWSRGKNL